MQSVWVVAFLEVAGFGTPPPWLIAVDLQQQNNNSAALRAEATGAVVGDHCRTCTYVVLLLEDIRDDMGLCLAELAGFRKLHEIAHAANVVFVVHGELAPLGDDFLVLFVLHESGHLDHDSLLHSRRHDRAGVAVIFWERRQSSRLAFFWGGLCLLRAGVSGEARPAWLGTSKHSAAPSQEGNGRAKSGAEHAHVCRRLLSLFRVNVQSR